MSRLSNEDRRALIEIARRAIVSAVTGERPPELSPIVGALAECCGAFVSLHRGEQLRGCVGQIESLESLAETVQQVAINSTLQDFRFRPVSSDEVRELVIEISVLSPLETIQPERIVAGVHGLLVTRHPYRGLLLPQVAAEREWTAERFLEETCAKAGLPRDAWRDSSTRIFAFTAEVFSETDVRAASRL